MIELPKGVRLDNIIIISFEGEPTNTLARKKLENPDKSEHYWSNWVSDEITDQKCLTYNVTTKSYAENSVYEGRRGKYIKKGGRKYYLDDFKIT